MRITTVVLILLFSVSAFSQTSFDLKDASKYFDIKVKVAECDDAFCRGAASFSFYRKGGSSPYQVIDLPDTLLQLDADSKPLTNVNLLYDEQSVVNIGDYNFDGMEDVAICDGANGSYNGPSYRIYLSSRTARKFVYSPALSKLGRHLGMFRVDKAKKTLETFDKSGCCWHITERYSVVSDRPVKIFEEIEDATIADETKVKITTRKRTGGRWSTAVKYVERSQ